MHIRNTRNHMCTIRALAHTIDQYALLRRCPQLIQEILNLLGQVWYLAKSGQGMGKERKAGKREGEGEKIGERESIPVFRL